MSGQTQQGLTKGAYAYCSHSLFVSGDIMDVFVGRWLTKEGPGGSARILQKFPPDEQVDGGSLLCVLKLRRPLSLPDYREVHHPELRPLVQNLDDDVKMVLVPADMLCTIPDGM